MGSTFNDLPEIDHQNKVRSKDLGFFKYPDNIGEIISAESTYVKGSKKLSGKEKTGVYVKFIGVSILISLAIIFLAKVENPIWILIWIAVPNGISIWLASASSSFSGECSFIGSKGFAFYEFQDSTDNIVKSIEINFDNVTDLFTTSVVKKVNYSYSGTDFIFSWLNDNKLLYEIEDTHSNKDNKPGEYPFNYYFMDRAERQWTFYLAQRIDSELAKNGCLEFPLIGADKNNKWFRVPYIKLEPNSITFYEGDQSMTYQPKDIKRLYASNGNLHIEHQNYQKRFLFKNKGNTNIIPLANLSNTKFFFKAMEIMLGYQF